jgi:hypothetical protein
MNNYQDKWTRFHDAPVTDKDPISSGNGWIYSAYAQKAGLLLDETKLKECFELCSQNGILVRNPNTKTSPISRDEILGMSALGLLAPGDMNGWNFSPFPLPKFSLFAFLSQLFLLFKNRKDRNYFWKNNLDQIYRFAFSVPFVDRHFILRKWGKFNLFYFLVAHVDSFGRASGIRWLKYGGLKNKRAMKSEFPADHPLQNV